MSEQLSSGVRPWDLVAEGYAATGATVLAPFAAHALEYVTISSESKIVDVAAGTGLLSVAAAELGAEVQAIDLSASMIDHLVAAAADHPAITARVGDGQALPYDDNSFDAAFSLFGLMFFPDRPKGFAELHRVLRPGGTAVVAAWASAAESSLMRALFGALVAADPTAALPQPNPRSLENPRVFDAEMRAAGLLDVRIQQHTVEVQYPDATALWESLTRSSANLAVVRDEVGEEEWQRRTEAAVDHLTVTYRPNTPLRTTALFGIGTAA
ncbi:class I SAM-dependent methyltransferase [Nocardia sp. NPDC058519]|uniref:class I SAM-dependent methyltransferase n=1 Tax=Nocardia sp. NPDC058519 TaxID=3346535 RepID=UPI003657F979